MRSLLVGFVVALSPVATAAAPTAFPVPASLVPQFRLEDWTPRPATGKAEPWEKATDKDWFDPRFRQMDTGPFLNATFEYPVGPSKEKVFKGTAIRLGPKGDAGVIFDRATMRLAAGWTGGWLLHSDRRFGLMNTPKPAGTMLFATPSQPGWALTDSPPWAGEGKPFTIPLPAAHARFLGLHVHGDRVVLAYRVADRKVLETAGTTASTRGGTAIVRTVTVGPGKVSVSWLPDAPGGTPTVFPPSEAPLTSARTLGFAANLNNSTSNFTEPGPPRWGKPIVTPLVRGNTDGPFAVDTLTIPHDNPFKALFFCTGLDHLPDGRIALCTAHGDVWLVKVDEAANTVAWQRFATGLYHPLGLKVVDGKVIVLERGQLTRLHDANHDGEADFYECVSNHWHTGPGEHAYDTCLETDPDGNFYFFKGGDTFLPHGGCLLKVARDGSKTEVFCTGFRHPIGMGMSPDGILTGADQEGNWMPATRIDQYTKGGFYGDMRAHHREVPPTTYDPPLCWVPREVDNSAGGQVWVPKGTWGALGGLPLHLSYGRCKAFVLLRQELKDGLVQGGVADLGLNFLSGVCRGRFGSDGHLYVCGLNGWQTAAKADGCLQRVRATGRSLDVPIAMAIDGNTLRLTFSRPLDPRTATQSDHWRTAWWNYEWSKEYGSKRWKVSDPKAEGQDEVPVRRVTLADDGRTAVLHFDNLQPVMQMQVAYNLATVE